MIDHPAPVPACPSCGTTRPAQWDPYRGAPTCTGCHQSRPELLPIPRSIAAGFVVAVSPGSTFAEASPAPVAPLSVRA